MAGIKHFSFQDITFEAIRFLGNNINLIECLKFVYENAPEKFLKQCQVKICDPGQWIVKTFSGEFVIIDNAVISAITGLKDEL